MKIINICSITTATAMIFAPRFVGAATEAANTNMVEPEIANLLYTPNDKFVDDMCVDYCNDYFFVYCQHHNTFLNSRHRRRMQAAGEWDPKAELNRSLVETQESEPGRGPDWTDSMQDCQEECMRWPRPLDPMSFWNSPTYDTYYDSFDSFVSNIGGDTYWCRHRHMTMATVFAEFGDFQGGFQSASAFHCSFSGIHGAGICRNSFIDDTNKTAYELLRDSQESRVHMGYCDIADDGKIADCSGLNTIYHNEHASNFRLVLESMPVNLEILFLNGIEGITMLDDDIFGYLPNPHRLLALHLDQCDLTGTLNKPGESPFRSLVNLQSLNINENRKITEINSGLLSGLTQLKEFSMFDHSLVTLPADLFDDCKGTLEIMSIYCLGGPQDKLGSTESFPTGFFDGMSNLETMSFVFCDFNSDEIADDSFNDLESLLWFDYFSNPRFTELKNAWFNCDDVDRGCGGSKLGESLLRFAMWGSGLSDKVFEEGGVGDRVFQNLDRLETVWMYNTNVTKIPYDTLWLEDKDKFEHFSIGSPWYNPTSMPSMSSSISPPTNAPTRVPTRAPTNQPVASHTVPVAKVDYAAVIKNEQVRVNVLVNDKRGLPDLPLYVNQVVTSGHTSLHNALNGICEVSADHFAVLYTPNSEFVGNDKCVYEACDGRSSPFCDTATIYFTVQAEAADTTLNGESVRK